jgi:DNA-directed RNA polymerase specialized sigma24 family protein
MSSDGRNIDGLGDDALLAGFGVGDEVLAGEFVRRFQHPVFGIVVGVVGDTGLAEDIAVQTFERAWSFAAVYDSRRGTVAAWLAAIAHSLAVDAVRARGMAPIDPSDLDALLGAVTWIPERAAFAAEATGLDVRTVMASLPVAQARALVMAAFRGMTAGEIAGVEKIPLGTAKTRIRAGLLWMHAALHPLEADQA